MNDRNEPLKIMAEIERHRRFFEHGGGRTLGSCADWQALRTALKTQRDELARLRADNKRLREVAECNDPGAVGQYPPMAQPIDRGWK